MSNDKRVNILATVALVAIFVCLYGFSRDDVVIELWVPLGLMAAAAAYCFWPRAEAAASQKKAHRHRRTRAQRGGSLCSSSS